MTVPPQDSARHAAPGAHVRRRHRRATATVLAAAPLLAAGLAVAGAGQGAAAPGVRLAPRHTGAAGAVGGDRGGRTDPRWWLPVGVAVSIGCSPYDAGRHGGGRGGCGISVVICTADGVTEYHHAVPAGRLSVGAGRPCGSKPPQPPTPTCSPSTRPPTTPAPTPTPTPTATHTPTPTPTTTRTHPPTPPTTGPVAPTPPPVGPSPHPSPRPRPAGFVPTAPSPRATPAAPASRRQPAAPSPSTPAPPPTSPPDTVLPLGQAPAATPPDDEAERWWLLSVLAVLLPALLAAAVPRGTHRRR